MSELNRWTKKNAHNCRSQRCVEWKRTNKKTREVAVRNDGLNGMIPTKMKIETHQHKIREWIGAESEDG